MQYGAAVGVAAALGGALQTLSPRICAYVHMYCTLALAATLMLLAVDCVRTVLIPVDARAATFPGYRHAAGRPSRTCGVRLRSLPP